MSVNAGNKCALLGEGDKYGVSCNFVNMSVHKSLVLNCGRGQIRLFINPNIMPVLSEAKSADYYL